MGSDTESCFGTFRGSNIDNADTTALDEANWLVMLAFKSATKGLAMVFWNENILSASIVTFVAVFKSSILSRSSSTQFAPGKTALSKD